MDKRILAIVAALVFSCAAPISALAQEDDEGYVGEEDSAPAYRSNNPCESGHMDDGTPVNCNNALGVEQPPGIIIIRPPPRFIFVAPPRWQQRQETRHRFEGEHCWHGRCR